MSELLYKFKQLWLVKSITKIGIFILIHTHPSWNAMWTKYKCEKCFWMDLGLGEVHPGGPNY